MYLYVLSSVLLISLDFFVMSCYVSLCSEFRVAHFIILFVLSCYVSVCSEFRVAHFFSFFLCCPLMCLYVLSSVLLISLVLFVVCCYVSLCSEFVLLISLVLFMVCCYVSVCSQFRVAHFFSFVRGVLLCIFMFWVPCCSFHNFFLCCPVMYLYVLSSVLLISLVCFVLSCYVSLCSEFRVAHFFSFVRGVLLCIFMFWVPCCSFL
jgi:hypothetical protein